jgi:hypothetical protein
MNVAISAYNRAKCLKLLNKCLPVARRCDTADTVALSFIEVKQRLHSGWMLHGFKTPSAETSHTDVKIEPIHFTSLLA